MRTRLEPDRSYRALLKLPAVGRILLGMQIARIGQSMVSVAIVLFALSAYRSPTIAGLATFFSIFPGLLVSPIAGALLDRHGRTRLVVLDYLVALAALVLMGSLAVAGVLPAKLLIIIAAVASLTTPLSATGLRSLFPLIVPSHLWERLNAIDSTGYVVATLIGPPFAASLVALCGGPVALIVIGLSFGCAALVIVHSVDPPTPRISNTSLLTQARQGLVYTWRNPTLRALGFSISVLNLAGGILNIVVPLIVLQRLQLGETAVGLIFSVQGLAGIISAFLFGRQDSRGRERLMLALPMVAMSGAVAGLLWGSKLAVLVLVMAVTGALNGPIDIGLFTLRQRRTDTEWTGRAFAVSMSFNYLGFPIGAAFAGVVAARSIEVALVSRVATCLIAGLIAAFMIPSK